MSEDSYKQPDLSLIGDEHVRRYVETNGAVGHEWSGVHTLVLTTTGRRTGERRSSAMIYGEDGGRYVVMASLGGAPMHPKWFLNLRANPEVEVQVGAKRFRAHAREAMGDERDRLWSLMTGIWPNFDLYQSRTERRIPVVVLEPVR
jgi:deazaflavin-dependent oxidoreductase (nitroreductase family)